jgi:hypothetical protein
MSKAEIVHYRKRDIKITVQLPEGDDDNCTKFADAILRARPSRLDNNLELDVVHRPDVPINHLIQLICDKGVPAITLKTNYPIPSPIASDPMPYMTWAYETGKVFEQWTDISRSDTDGDDLMVDVLKIGFIKKMVTDCVWDDDSHTPVLRLIDCVTSVNADNTCHD